MVAYDTHAASGAQRLSDYDYVRFLTRSRMAREYLKADHQALERSVFRLTHALHFRCSLCIVAV